MLVDGKAIYPPNAVWLELRDHRSRRYRMKELVEAVGEGAYASAKAALRVGVVQVDALGFYSLTEAGASDEQTYYAIFGAKSARYVYGEDRFPPLWRAVSMVREKLLKFEGGRAFTIPQIAKSLDVSYTAAKRAVQALELTQHVVTMGEELVTGGRGRPSRVYIRTERR